MGRLREFAGLLSGVPFAVAYGVLARLAFSGDGSNEFLFAPLSAVFLLLVPAVVGALAVWMAPATKRTNWGYALATAVASCLIATVITGLLAIEALICVLMASPILLSEAAIGGALACWLMRRRERTRTNLMGLLIVPFLLAPFESLVPVADFHGRVSTQITIEADPAAVWGQITSVPRIQPEERRYSVLFDLLNVPRPLEATLGEPGSGGMRYGWFEQNLRFDERIAAWEPGRRIAWDITVGDRGAVPAPWREIGGRAFDVTGASYWIEPVDSNTLILHLDSTYRLSTRFNGYGSRWVTWGLGEFQGEVLHVIKGRAERDKMTR
jgi:hypothetical protein